MQKEPHDIEPDG